MILWVATGLHFLGIFLNIKKLIACWLVWIAASGLILIEALGRHDAQQAVLFGGYILFNVWGWIAWARKGKGDVAATAPPRTPRQWNSLDYYYALVIAGILMICLTFVAALALIFFDITHFPQ